MSRFVKSCVILVVSADALQIARKKKEINKGSSWFSNNVISRGFTAMKNGANVAITTSGITVGLQALKFNRCREINQDLVKDACSGEAKDPDSRVTDHMIQTSLDYYKKDMDEVVKRAHNTGKALRPRDWAHCHYYFHWVLMGMLAVTGLTLGRRIVPTFPISKGNSYHGSGPVLGSLVDRVN
ncbi:unnamed protein product [Amoebophrya sp. A25]|nr:unnamed protein product [Amoebophrya sp. A25]|eukprot:GSA25T00022123001.1